MSSVLPVASSFSNVACPVREWLVSTASTLSKNAIVLGKAVSHTLNATAAKIAQTAVLMFNSLSQYAAIASNHIQNTAAFAWALAQANPKIALSGFAITTLVGAAIYMYSQQRSAPKISV